MEDNNTSYAGGLMKQILVTHTDLDGAGCAILFKRHYPNIEIRYCDYDTIDEVSKELWNKRDNYDAIYFADITPNEEYGLKMLEDRRFTLIDHHITREYLNNAQHENVIYNTNFCATYLTAKYFGSYISDRQDNRDFILAVDAYDTWKLDSPQRGLGLSFNLLFDYYGMETFVEQFANMRFFNDKEYIILGVLKKIEHDYLAEKLEQGGLRFDKAGTMYFEIYVSERSAHIGLLIDNPDFPADCQYIKSINLNDRMVGLYSKHFDVSKVAKAHGGGGHKTAAGYTIKFLQPIYV